MGMFDSVYVTCPKCKELVECQSKNGPCMLKKYTLESAPPDVVGGILGGDGWVRCETCKGKLIIEPPKNWTVTFETDESDDYK